MDEDEDENEDEDEKKDDEQNKEARPEKRQTKNGGLWDRRKLKGLKMSQQRCEH